LVYVLLASFTVTSADLVFGPEVRIDMHPDGTTGGPGVVRRSDGRFCVIWGGENTGPDPFRIWSSYSDDFGETWSDQTAVGDFEALGSQFPKIDSDSLGKFYVVWHDWRGPEPYAPYFSRSLDGGETWLWPNVKITDDGEVGLSPGIAANADGSRLVAVFDRLNENRIYSSYSTDVGLSWSVDVPVGDITSGGQYYPVTEHIGGQSYVALWKDERDTISAVYCSVSEDGGETWLSSNIPVPFGGHGLLEHSLDLHWDGSILHAFWIELYWTDLAEITEVFYSQSSDGGYTWLSEPVRVDTAGTNVQRRRGGIWARSPADIYAVWCSFKNVSYPIYAVCSVSSDSGKTWSIPVTANPVSGEAYICDIYGDETTGEVLLVWDNQINQFIKCAHGYENTGIEEEPSPFHLFIRGNPFSSSLSINYSLPEPAQVELSVYDLTGRLVENLESESAPAGEHASVWVPDPEFPNGCYLIVLDACGERAVRRCVRLN
jgi:hypothetical protein